jgi:hypothetical protein
MADIITLDNFINMIRQSTSLVTVEDVKKPLGNEEFANKLIGALGAVKAERAGLIDLFNDAGPFQWSDGVRLNDLKKVTELIPAELRTDWAIETVNWDLFIKSVEDSGVKVNDNVKNNISPAYIKLHNELVLGDAGQLVAKANGSGANLEATKEAYGKVWLEQPFNSNIKNIVGYSTLDNSKTVVGEFLAEVDRIVSENVVVGSSPSTTVPSIAPTENESVPSTTVPAGSSKPSLDYESTAGLNCSGVIVNDPASLTGATDVGAQAALTPQEWLFQNPDSTYLDLMMLPAQGKLPVENAVRFGKKYGYFNSESGNEWTIRSFYDLPVKMNSIQIGKLQDDLRKAGFFAYEGGRLPLKGTLDDPTTQAWAYFLQSAALAGEDPASHLVKRIQGVAQVQWDSEVMGRDPETIKSRANDLGGAVLGRGLRPEEIKQLEDVVRGWEKEAVRQGNYADEPMQVDLNARIEGYLKDTYQDGAVWTNFANSQAATSRYWG